MTTGAAAVPPHKLAQGYRYAPDKFAVGGLTPQRSDLVAPPRIAQCPIQLECEVVAAHPIGDPEPHATAFQLLVRRSHVDEDLVIPGTSYVDPVKWDPLIMKFCEFFGDGVNVHPSRLADGLAHAAPGASRALAASGRSPARPARRSSRPRPEPLSDRPARPAPGSCPRHVR